MAHNDVSNTQSAPEKNGRKKDSSNRCSTIKNNLHKVTFDYDLDPNAESVSLVGTFNNWDETADPMTKVGDRFHRIKKLFPGEHHYKFVVDGRWREDPRAEAQIANEFGTLNSVIKI